MSSGYAYDLYFYIYIYTRIYIYRIRTSLEILSRQIIPWFFLIPTAESLNAVLSKRRLRRSFFAFAERNHSVLNDLQLMISNQVIGLYQYAPFASKYSGVNM
jgi:hypothetical protein